MLTNPQAASGRRARDNDLWGFGAATLPEMHLDLRSLLELLIGADGQFACVIDDSLALWWTSETLARAPLFSQLFDRVNPGRPVTLRDPSELASMVRGRLGQPPGPSKAQLAEIGCECKVTALPTVMLGNGPPDELPKLALVLLTRRGSSAGSVSPGELNLTRVEYQLVLHIMAGRNVRQAAECMRISYNTARKYLQNVFAKTGVKRQAALVAHVSQLMAQQD